MVCLRLLTGSAASTVPEVSLPTSRTVPLGAWGARRKSCLLSIYARIVSGTLNSCTDCALCFMML